MKVDLYDASGVQKGSLELKKEIFEAKINEDLMHRAVVRQLSNARKPIAHTKTRGDVIMTTAKAFKQKGTGRARRGAKSTSMLRGGGVTHGPRNTRNFIKDMPQKERRAALFSSLTVKAKNHEIFALESFAEKTPKTKKFVELLQKFPEAKKYLFVLSGNATEDILRKSSANVPNVKTISARYLSPYHVLQSEKICFLTSALDTLNATFLSSKTE